MSATQQLMDLARAKQGLTSDYQLANALGTSTQRVSNWRTGRGECDEDMAERLAKLAGVPIAYAILATAAGKVSSEETRAMLLREAERLAA